MGTFKHPRVFDYHDLEIMDHVFDVALAQLEAREPFRDKERDGERRAELCKLILDQTGTDRIEFSTLCGRVLANMTEAWPVFTSGELRK
jgi:hypothetical protein